MRDDDEQDKTADPTERDADLLREIRDNFAYGMDYWKETREHRQTLLRALCNDPWPKEERQTRKDNDRICINHDELNQYVFQGVNNLRQSKRGIKVEPRGNGATEKSAELRQDLTRTIEYQSMAQSAYLRAGQDMFEGSYGFCRVTRRYVDEEDEESTDQEIVIKPIPNPDSVIYDPDCKEADWSDAQWCFVIDPITRGEFKRRWPDAQKIDFSNEDMRIAPDWIKDKNILVAEYWKLVVTPTKGKRGRKVVKKKLVQYMTNGVEILETNKQIGKEIPIPAFIGLERYVDEGSGPKRKLFGLPSFALEPQLSLAYLCSQEMEEAGMAPKVPVMGYTGQFETDAGNWEVLNKISRPFIQVDPVVDAVTNQVLPLPQWRQFLPNFQAYELAKDSCRRAIQAAMGISPLPTAAQRSNEKSGAALDKIEQQEAIGSYHFVEGYERGVTRCGRIVESWMKETYDTERDQPLQTATDDRKMIRLNTPEPYANEKGEMEHYVLGDEKHDITVSTAPSNLSQRDAVDDFLNNLIGNLKNLPIAPPAASKLLAKAVRMKNLGPRGDEMADIISPPDANQGQAMQQLQAQYQQQGEALQQLQGELQKLLLERQGKVIENAGKMDIERLRIEGQATAAEINTKAQSLEERVKFVEDLYAQLHSQAHEAGMQAQDHQQTLEQQQQSAAQTSQQQQQQAAIAQQQQPPSSQQ